MEKTMLLNYTRIAVIFFLFSASPSNAQQPTVNADIRSYQYYLLANWDSVAYYGNIALDQKTDHYFIRMRLGIAYYFKNNFLTAAYHFEKALDFEPASMDAKKYLYYCYLYANRKQHAESVIRKLNETEKNNFSFNRPSWIQSFSISAGNKFSDQKKVKGNQGYFSAGASHALTRYAQLIYQYTYLKQSLTNKISITQHQFYATVPLYFSKRITCIPALHFVTLSDGFTSSTLLAKHIELKYDYKKISWSAFGSQMGPIKNGTRQAGVNLIFYPFGNLNLYHRLSAVVHKDFASKSGSTLVLNFMSGIKLSPRIWLEAEGTYGDRTNYIESAASVIHNTPDIMKEKWALTPMILTGDNQMLYIKYIREHKKEFLTGKSFYHNAVYGGYQWTF